MTVTGLSAERVTDPVSDHEVQQSHACVTEHHKTDGADGENRLHRNADRAENLTRSFPYQKKKHLH